MAHTHPPYRHGHLGTAQGLRPNHRLHVGGTGCWRVGQCVGADRRCWPHVFRRHSALWLAWWAAQLSKRGFDQQLSYGYHRFQVLAAFVNGLTLVALIVWITVEVIQRLFNPEIMNPWPTLIVATSGFVVNLIAFRLLHNTSGNTNIRSAALHVFGDLLGSVAAMIAAAAVMVFGWLYADPVLTLGIVMILSRGAYRVLRESGYILLEGVPAGLDLAKNQKHAHRGDRRR